MIEDNIVTKENFRQWLHHPVTKQVFTLLAGQRRWAYKAIIEHANIHESGYGKLCAKCAGYIHAINDILLIKFEDISNGKDELLDEENGEDMEVEL